MGSYCSRGVGRLSLWGQPGTHLKPKTSLDCKMKPSQTKQLALSPPHCETVLLLLRSGECLTGRRQISCSKTTLHCYKNILENSGLSGIQGHTIVPRANHICGEEPVPARERGYSCHPAWPGCPAITTCSETTSHPKALPWQWTWKCDIGGERSGCVWILPQEAGGCGSLSVLQLPTVPGRTHLTADPRRAVLTAV